MNLQMFKLDLEKAKEPEIKLPTSTRSLKNQESSRRNIYLRHIDYAKFFDCVDHNKLWKILKEIDHLTCLWEICIQVKKQQLELDIKQQTGSKLIKEYIDAVFCQPAYLTYTQSASCEMPDWMKHKQESRLPGGISITSDMQMTAPLWQKAKKNLRLLMNVKEKSEKVGLKLNIQNTKFMTSGPITSRQINGETVRAYFGGLQNYCRW